MSTHCQHVDYIGAPGAGQCDSVGFSGRLQNQAPGCDTAVCFQPLSTDRLPPGKSTRSGTRILSARLDDAILWGG